MSIARVLLTLVIACVSLIGFLAITAWLMDREMSEVNLSVSNESSSPIRFVTLQGTPVPQKGEYMRLGGIGSGESKSSQWHMPTTLGRAWIVVRSEQGQSIREAGYLLDDDGPYVFKVTVKESEISVWRDNNEDPVTWKMEPATQPWSH